MMKKNIAVLGTGSDVGKSIVAAGICRMLAERKISCAPFKAQNMSNNSGITPEGLEMGRAQIVQAEAAGIVPHVDMNPILLKPTGEKKSQVVLNGKVHGNHSAMDYHLNKKFYFKKACEAFDRLQEKFEVIILEGAGSCAEVNLMANDIVNFEMAAYANADVILTADIHRGGVFAQIVGTLACIPQKYQDMIKGVIINRFRGDAQLFQDGRQWIEQKTKKKVLGVLPWYHHFKIDAEDSVEIEACGNFRDYQAGTPAIGVIRLPHIANFTDFHALSKVDTIQTLFIDKPDHLSKCKAVIIPGSKNTRKDLEWLLDNFKDALTAYSKINGRIFGICGGYQMLGEVVNDPDGLEGVPGKSKGLGFLSIHTTLKSPKITTLSEFSYDGVSGKGYEIHMGETSLLSGIPLLDITMRNDRRYHDTDGCLSQNGLVAGTYVHGFFDTWPVLSKWLKWVGAKTGDVSFDRYHSKENDYRLLSEHVEKHVDLSSIITV